MAPPLDIDWLFLETVISLSSDISEWTNTIKETSDDPAVLKQALYIESNALLIWKQAKDYRARLTLLKRLAEQDGAQRILEEIGRLAGEIMAATGQDKNGKPTKVKQRASNADKGKPSSLSV